MYIGVTGHRHIIVNGVACLMGINVVLVIVIGSCD